MNLLLDTDSYKYTHWKQYPPKTQRVYSYLESRGGQFPYTVFFGLQYILHILKRGFNKDDVYEAAALCMEHFGTDKMFNEKGFLKMLSDHNGRFPVRIKAVPEGSVVPVGNVLMTIENTDDDYPWLTNFLETMLLRVWYPITVATQSRVIKEIILNYLQETGDPAGIPFKLHDFGCRGVSSQETAAIGGAAHLVNFMGTDTVPALKLLLSYYKSTNVAGFSIPASEHSTITSWGKDGEAKAYANMLEQYPKGLVACVSDSFDIENACRNIWGDTLREKVMKRKGTLVIRPDSGDPVTMVLKVLDILGERFGAEANSKGYKVLPPCVRVIQGDGVNIHSINAILREMKDKGWSADNVAFGMGGALLQQLNRDTQKFAIKCSNITIDGVDREVYKEPKSDSGKNSKRGRLALVVNDGAPVTFDEWDKTYKTIPQKELVYPRVDELVTVFENGNITKEYNLEDIRKLAEIPVTEEVAA